MANTKVAASAQKTIEGNVQQYLWCQDWSPNTDTLISIWSCPSDTSFGATKPFSSHEKKSAVCCFIEPNEAGCQLCKDEAFLAELIETGCTVQASLKKAKEEHLHTVVFLEVSQTESK